MSHFPTPAQRRHRLLSVLLAVTCLLPLSHAAAQREVTATYQLGAGKTNVLDTYLSQEKFSGIGLTFLATREHRLPGRHWSTLVEHEFNYSTAHDRAETCREILGDYTLLMGRLRAWRIGRLQLQAGLMGSLNLGAIYNPSNSNNPAQARFSLQSMPTGAAHYDFTLFSRRLRLRYELQLPLLGIMFSPNYGQSYYEIFSEGNYDHNIVPTTLVATPCFRQQLSVEYSIPRFATLRLGYLGNYQQAQVNNLKSHTYLHRLTIGIVKEFEIKRKTK